MSGIGLHAAELFLSVVPDAGGRTLELVHKPTGFKLFWQNPLATAVVATMLAAVDPLAEAGHRRAAVAARGDSSS